MTEELRFVIHKHAARRLHYDLRLEWEGVLKSWAVPKEPTAERGVKRLAIEVEDHALEYIDFSGDIEEDNYGAGKVEIWDSGEYEMLECGEELIRFRLHGKKLKGHFKLVKMKWSPGNQWLFMKGKEDSDPRSLKSAATGQQREDSEAPPPGRAKRKRKESKMAKVDIEYTDRLAETVEALADGRVLLASQGKSGKPNAMAIGWGTVGVVWGRAMFVVLVRPSRHTYKLMEEIDDFTVNVAPPELKDAVTYCGTASGRDHDKLKEKKLTTSPGKKVKSPIIEECILHYECKVVHKNDVIKNELAKAIISEFYPEGDYHRIYFGEILATYATK